MAQIRKAQAATPRSRHSVSSTGRTERVWKLDDRVSAADLAGNRRTARFDATAQPLVVSVPEACTLLRVSRWTLYQLIRRGELPPSFYYRRLSICYERKANRFTAFFTLAATLTCYKKSPNETRSKMTVRFASEADKQLRCGQLLLHFSLCR